MVFWKKKKREKNIDEELEDIKSDFPSKVPPPVAPDFLKKRIDEINTRHLAVKIRDLAINGHKVMKTLGLSQGPEVGRILQALIEKVTDHPELNTEEKLLALAKELKNNLASTDKTLTEKNGVKSHKGGLRNEKS